MAKSAPTYYRFTDSDGVAHLVQSRGAVPEQHQDSAKAVRKGLPVHDTPKLLDELAQQRRKLADAHQALTRLRPAHASESAGLHPPSVVVGALGGLLLGVFVLGRLRRALLKVALVAGLAGAAAIAYLTFLQQSADLSSGLATPRQIVEQAREAAAVAEQRLRAQTERLEAIEGASTGSP